MNLKELLFGKIFTLRRLFLVGNILVLVLFLAALLKDQKRGWTYYQKTFKSKEIERTKAKLNAAKTGDEKAVAAEEFKAAKRMPVEIRQLWVQELDAVDRCITCHTGYDPLYNTSLTTPYKEQPYSASPEAPAFDIHKAHNVEKFGCVVCHGGQGSATEVDAAHGHVAHWETPLLKGTLIQASCAKCHDNVAQLSVNGKTYPTAILEAKKLFRDLACIGCHQIGGEGGPISVDLKEETSAKPLSRIDFGYTGLDHKEQTLANWIKIHMTRDPATFVPGDPEGKFNTEPIAPSAMPPYLLPEDQAEALTAYILSLNRKNIPSGYLRPAPPEPKPQFASQIEHGRWVYEQYGCGACHGSDARGGIRNFNYQYDGTPNLRRSATTFTREGLEEKISNGVPFLAKHDPKGPNPPLYMPPWKDKIKGEELDSLVAYLLSIRE